MRTFVWQQVSKKSCLSCTERQQIRRKFFANSSPPLQKSHSSARAPTNNMEDELSRISCVPRCRYRTSSSAVARRKLSLQVNHKRRQLSEWSIGTPSHTMLLGRENFWSVSQNVKNLLSLHMSWNFKKKQIPATCSGDVKHSSFVPLFSFTGGAAPGATRVIQRLAEKVEKKNWDHMPTPWITSEPKLALLSSVARYFVWGAVVNEKERALEISFGAIIEEGRL